MTADLEWGSLLLACLMLAAMFLAPVIILARDARRRDRLEQQSEYANSVAAGVSRRQMGTSDPGGAGQGAPVPLPRDRCPRHRPTTDPGGPVTLTDDDILTTRRRGPAAQGDADQGDTGSTQVDPEGSDPTGADSDGGDSDSGDGDSSDSHGGDADQGDTDSTQVDPSGSDPAGADQAGA